MPVDHCYFSCITGVIKGYQCGGMPAFQICWNHSMYNRAKDQLYCLLQLIYVHSYHSVPNKSSVR